MTTDTQDLSDDGWESDDDGVEGQDGAGADSADDGGAAAGSSPDNDRTEGADDGGARRRRRRRGRDTNDLESFDERSRQAQGFVDQVIQKMGMDCRVRLRRPREGDS